MSQIHLICVGRRMPAWIETGFQDYARRLPKPWALRLVEIPLAKRGKHTDVERCRREEGERMLGLLDASSLVVALDEHGSLWSTQELARRLQAWLAQGRKPCLLVGGPDGLDGACLHRADQRWSLSPLTLPHALVRVVVAEQIYRAWTILQQHPYHRE